MGVGQCLGTLLWSQLEERVASDSWGVGPGMLLNPLPWPGRPHSARSGSAWQQCRGGTLTSMPRFLGDRSGRSERASRGAHGASLKGRGVPTDLGFSPVP